MKHYIIAKFNKEVDKKDIPNMLVDIKAIYNEALTIEGIHNIEFKLNCTQKDNRFDLMIILDMDKEALDKWAKCAPHLLWKEKYTKYLESKTIFDSED